MRAHVLFLVVAANTASGRCPPPENASRLHELPPAELVELLVRCSTLAQQRRSVLDTAASVLATALAAPEAARDLLLTATRAVLVGSKDEDKPPPVPSRTRRQASETNDHRLQAAHTKQAAELPTWHQSREDQRTALEAQAERVRVGA